MKTTNSILKKNRHINYLIIVYVFICFSSYGKTTPAFFSVEFNVGSNSKNIKAVDAPSILFIFNSARMYREKDEDDAAYDLKIKIMIERAKKIFDEEPSTVIEICGHCDFRETNKKKLSYARAKYIANELIKKGVSKRRIIVKGEGDEEPLVSEKIIKEASTQDDKENFSLRNRRVTFKILRWDYKNN